MSRASTVLAGVAAVGVATGVVLILSRPKKDGPELRLRVSGERAIASAGWRF